MNNSVEWGVKLSLCSVMLVMVSNLNAQKFHVAGHLVKCAGNDKLPANSIFFIEGNSIPSDCVKILGAGDAVPVAKGSIYNQENVQGIGLPGGLWRKSGSTIKSNIEGIKLNEVGIKGGNNNIVVGNASLEKNTTGHNNISVGNASLEKNTTGHNNISVGNSSLEKNTTGHSNISIGSSSLENNTNGKNNLAIGSRALEKNVLGNSNIALGDSALLENYDGNNNIALGRYATQDTKGSHNIAIGYRAGVDVKKSSRNTTIGNDVPGVDIEGYTVIGSNGQNSIVINKTGFVGIGTNEPGVPLHVAKKVVYKKYTQIYGAMGDDGYEVDNYANHEAEDSKDNYSS